MTWITSSIQPYLPDINQLIAVMMQVLMWMTPVLYSEDTFKTHQNVLFLLKLNPLYYIVKGYREAVYHSGWFWQHPALTLYFWGVTICLLLVGAVIFRCLRLHFSDVL